MPNDDNSIPDPSHTPSQIVMKVLEEFSEHEPSKVLIIYLDEEGFVRHRSSSMYDHERLGLIEIIKRHLLDRIGS